MKRYVSTNFFKFANIKESVSSVCDPPHLHRAFEDEGVPLVEQHLGQTWFSSKMWLSSTWPGCSGSRLYSIFLDWTHGDSCAPYSAGGNPYDILLGLQG